jgi:hypothetical protein
MRRSGNRQGVGAARDGIGGHRAGGRDRHRPVLDRAEDDRRGQAGAGLPVGRSQGLTTTPVLWDTSRPRHPKRYVASARASHAA